MLPNKARLLDVRHSPIPPIAESVSIPEPELPGRVHELPSRHEPVVVVDTGPEARRAVEFLETIGRPGSLSSEFIFGDPGKLRLWSPNPFLQSCLGSIPVGRALDVACGSGRDAVLMASTGFEVRAVDHLPEALEMGRDLARRYQDGGPPIGWICADLEEDPPLGEFKLATCFYYLDRGLLRRIVRDLQPGGHLVFETFTTIHRAERGKPRTESFVLKPDELLEIVGGFDVLHYDEDWHEDRHTARLWAKKAGNS